MIGILIAAIPVLAALAYWLDRNERAMRWVVVALVSVVLLGCAAFVHGGDVPLTGILLLGETTSLSPDACLAVVIAALIVFAVVAVAREQAKPMVFAPSVLVGLGGVGLSASFGGNPVAMALALALIVPVLIGCVPGDTPSSGVFGAARRYLTWGTLAVSALVVSGLLERLYARQPGPGILAAVAGLFVVGIGILANVIPLSLWLPSLADESPLSAAAVSGLLTSGLVAIVAIALASDPWLLTEPSSQRGLAAVGGGGGLLSVVLAVGERNPSRGFAYLVSASGGFFLALLSISPRGDSAGVTWFLAAQALATGLGFTCLAASEGKLTSLLGRRPAAALGLWVSTLSLVGIPLTAGYVGRAMVAPTMAAQHPIFLVIAALTSAIGGIAVTRIFGTVFERAPVARESILTFDVVAVAMSALLVATGLLPSPILALLR